MALIIGYCTRIAAVLSGLLTLAFAIGMAFGIGIHAPLGYSVFAVAAGAFLLAGAEGYPWALDSWTDKTRSSASSMAGKRPNRCIVEALQLMKCWPLRWRDKSNHEF